MISDTNSDSRRARLYTVHVPVALALAMLGGIALLIDVQVAAYLFQNRPPGLVRKFVGMSEIFGHGFGTALVVVTISFLDPSRRRFLPRFAAASVAASICAHVTPTWRASSALTSTHSVTGCRSSQWMPTTRASRPAIRQMASP